MNADDPGIVTAAPMSLTDKNPFAYCFNNPVMYIDETGDFPWLIVTIVVVAAVVVSAVINHSINAINESNIEQEIQPSYTEETAEIEINKILSKYGGDIKIKFNDDDVEITNSYLVTSRYDRQKISMIITRIQGKTDREYDDLSAEWFGHNVIHFFHGSDSTKNVNLEHKLDGRWWVELPTDILEFLGWE